MEIDEPSFEIEDFLATSINDEGASVASSSEQSGVAADTVNKAKRCRKSTSPVWTFFLKKRIGMKSRKKSGTL